MSSAGLHGFFDIQQSPSVRSPAPTFQRDSNKRPTAIELDEHPWGKKHNGPPSSEPQTPMEVQLPSGMQSPMEPTTPKTPNELEMSRPPSPRRDEAVGPVQSWHNPPMNKWRVLSCCLIYFGNGINDSATGALIPYMETHYHIGYAVMSLIFVGQAAGFIFAAFFNDTVLDKIGRARMLMTAEGVMLAAYVMLVCTPPFGVVIVA